MNFDFSIESFSDKIQNANTRVYFKEVYQTFVNGNYRSSIVMLYSVLICDLVYKLRDLRDLYSEFKAKKILDEIEQMQTANPNSPEWESKLIELIKIRTALLEPSDIVAIESLQKFRHLSAHPVLNNADLLYSPNRDTVQSLIRNILEGVLTNPPFFSNKIFDTMLADLSEVKDKINAYDSLEKYVKSRYLDRIKETDFRKIFRSLWKVVFITEDPDSTSNRKINYKVLKIIISYNKPVCVSSLKNEPTYYSNINKDEHVARIIRLLALFPEFYNSLEDSLKLLIETRINHKDDSRFIAWFAKSSIVEHLTSLNAQEFTNISDSAFTLMKSISDQNGCKKEYIDFSLEYFGLSNSFAIAQNRYDSIITYILGDFSLEQTKRLLLISENNFQIHQRTGMAQKLRNVAKKYDESIEKTLYPNIFE